MFETRSCFGGALLAWLIGAMAFKSASAGLWFAVWPLGFGVAGLLRR